MKFSIVKHRKIWYTISGAIVIVSVLATAIYGLKFGIDFTGGSLLEIKTESVVQTGDVRLLLEEQGSKGVTVQSTDNNGLLIRMESLTEQTHQELLKKLSDKFGKVEELKFDSIGPVIGNELRRTATTGVIITLILIGLYVALAFKKVTYPVSSWKFGTLTILTAFHDVVVPVGVFAVLGHFYQWEIGTAFVAAILTVLGYSITDTIVVFDRTRENLLKRTYSSFEETVEHSIQQTIRRSLSTSITTLLALFAIFIFGGESTKPFALALIVGISVGTYSSIFLASPALITWEKFSRK